MDKQPIKRPARAQYAISGSLALVTLGIIYAWSIFREPLKELFPQWTDSNLSLTFTIIMFTYAFGNMLGAKLAEKFGRRMVCYLTALCMFVGFFGASGLNPENGTMSLLLLYIYFGGFGGLGTGLGYITMCENVSLWYPDRSGFAMGMVEMGFGFGALIMGGAADILKGYFGILTTFRILGIATALILCVVALFMKNPPEALLTYATSVQKETGNTLGKDYTTREMIRTPEFWSLMIWSTIVSAAFMMVVDNAASVAAYYGLPAVMGLMVSVSNGGIRLVTGLLVDRFGIRRISIAHNAIIILCGVSMLVAGYLRSSVMLIAGLIITGMAFGGTPTMLAIYMRRRYGQTHFSANYSLTSWGLLISAAIGPTASGVLQNLAAQTGANNYYLTTLILMLGFCVVGVITGIPYIRRADS